MRKILLVCGIALLCSHFIQAQNRNKNKNSLERKKDLLEFVEESFYPISNNPTKNQSVKSEDYGDAPEWKWASKFGGSGEDYFNGIVVDTNGNMYVVGSFKDELTVDSETLKTNGKQDAILFKYDKQGNMIWFKHITANMGKEVNLFDICIDQNDNVHIIGTYTGNIQVGSNNLSDESNLNLFITSLNPGGDYINAFNFTNEENYTLDFKLDIDIDGNFYALATTFSNSNSVLFKFDNYGSLVWKQQHDERLRDIAVGTDYYYLTGEADRDDDGVFDDNTNITQSGALADVFLLKGSLDGDYVWVKGASGQIYLDISVGAALEVDTDGNIYMGGYFWNTVTFGPDKLDIIMDENGRNQNGSGFITKCTSEGTFLWAKVLEGHAKDIAIGNNNVFVLSDYLKQISKTGTVGMSIPYGAARCIALNSSEDILIGGFKTNTLFISQLNGSAIEQWTDEFEGNTALADVIGMVADSAGNFYTYGYASGNIEFYGESINSGLFLSKQNYLGEVLWIRDFDDLKLEADYGNYIVLDPKEENIFITGELKDTFEIAGEESLTPTRDNGYFIVKYSTEGAYHWAIQEDIEGSELCLTADYSGNILISGTFCCDTDTIGSTEIISEGGSDVFIAKYDANGDFLWARRAGGEATEFSGIISVDGDDNVYLCSESISNNVTVDETEIVLNDGDGNIIFSKLNASGEVQWVKSLAGTTNGKDANNWPTGIITDKDGYSYIKGWHGDSVSFDNVTLHNPYGLLSFFIAKLDPAGNTLWANSINENDANYGFDYNQMDVDKHGNVYFGAQVRDTIRFGEEFIYKNVGVWDIFLTKYTSDGTLDWVKTIPSAEAWLSSVAVWDNNTVFVGGNFKDDITFGDQKIISTNQNGFIAFVGIDTTTTEEVLTCASDNNIVLNESQELLVPDLTGEVASINNYTAEDSLIITQDPEAGTYLSSGEGTIHEVIITVEDEEGNAETCMVILTGALQTNIDYLEGSDQEMLIYPNPSTDVINILFETQNEPIEFKLYDMYGRLVLTKVTDESNQITISKSEVNGSGIYIIKINNNQVNTGKIIFQ